MSNEPDEMLPEYDLSGARPSPYADRFYKKYGLIRLDADVAAIFPDVESANRALRALVEVIRVREEAKTKTP